MSPADDPPRIAERLARSCLPDTPANAAAIGDLREGWERRREAHGRAAAARWYRREAASLVAHHLARAVRSATAGLRGDIVVAARAAWRRPLVVGTGVLTLGPALAAAGVGLALVWTILARPLPHPDAGRLVVIEHTWAGFGTTGISSPLHAFYSEHARTVERIGLVTWETLSLGTGTDARRVPAARVTAATLELLGARPLAGRLFTEADDRARGAGPVLLTHRLWVDRYGADPAVVGRTVMVDAEAREIAGVLAPGLEFPGGQPRLVVPAGIDPASRSLLNITWWYALARLTPGADAAAAGRELAALLGRAVVEAPDGSTTAATLERNAIHPVVTGLAAWQTARARDFVLTLGAAVTLLLALAFAAVATLVIGRGISRAGELRLRWMLGARSGRIVRQLLAESALLCGIVGAVGAIAAWAAARALLASPALDLPRTDVPWIPTIAAAAALGLAALLVPPLGLLPLARRRLSDGPVGDRSAASWTGLRQALLGAQVTVATVLLAATLALGASVRAVVERPLGFRADGVVTFLVSLPPARYGDAGSAAAFHRAVLTRIRGLPGVTAAGHADGLPAPSAPWGGAMLRIDAQPDHEALPTHHWGYVSEGFLETMGVRLVAGRLLDERDMEAGRRVLLVNEPFARRYWGDPQAAVGRRVRRSDVWFDVVGVVAATAGDGRDGEPAPLVYAPSGAEPRGMPYAYYAVRTTGSPPALVDALRRAVVEVDDTVPLADVMTMEGRVAAASARERLALRGIGISVAASIAVVVASLAGLLLLSLLQRRREIGIRKAVGATDLRLRLLLARGVLLPAAAGVVAGAGLVLAGLRVPASLLQGGAEVAVPLAVAGALLAAVVLTATAMTSRGVARIEASQALRAD